MIQRKSQGFHPFGRFLEVRKFSKFLDPIRLLFSNKQSDLASESTRCGRCAYVLPDETLSYCPRCGVPFSTTYPTNSFQTLAGHHHDKMIGRHRQRIIALSCFVFVGFWGLFAAAVNLQNHSKVLSLHPVRPITVHIVQSPDFPQLSSGTLIASVGVAQQAFKDHFGIAIEDIQIVHGKMPSSIEDQLPNFWEDEDRNTLAFWEKKVFAHINMSSYEYASSRLPIILTNIPIIKNPEARSQLETRHLNEEGLISGLGHPGLVLATSYRMRAEEIELLGPLQGQALENSRARFLGEYILAHELGHALLGLKDYVGPDEITDEVTIRSPAEEANTGSAFPYHQCLMHTDRGGGYDAWKSLRARKLGKALPQICQEYVSLIQSFHTRAKALELYRRGEEEKAHDYYLRLNAEAANDVHNSSKNWLRYQWAQEEKLFLSFFNHWWNTIFMIESDS